VKNLFADFDGCKKPGRKRNVRFENVEIFNKLGIGIKIGKDLN